MSEDKKIQLVIPGEVNRKLVLKLLDIQKQNKNMTKAELIVELLKKILK